MSETPLTQAPTANEQIRANVDRMYTTGEVDNHFRAWEKEVSPNAVEEYDSQLHLDAEQERDALNYLDEIQPETFGESVAAERDETEETRRSIEHLSALQLTKLIIDTGTYVVANVRQEVIQTSR